MKALAYARLCCAAACCFDLVVPATPLRDQLAESVFDTTSCHSGGTVMRLMTATLCVIHVIQRAWPT
jgi:hypothetical protein